ncbi:MAG TPA: ABC transporter permease [Natronosporangium sp.]|nr:ABC transporter permease [Natronosporangium sp.]
MNPVWSVAAREIVTRGRSRSYLIGLAVSVLLVAAVALLPSLFGGRTHQVGVVGGAADLPEQLVAQATAAELRVTVMRVPDEPAARAAVADRELTAVLLADRGVVLTDGGIDPRLGQVLEAAHQRHRTAQALQAAGLSPTVIEQALTVSPLVYRPVHGDETDTMAGFWLALVVVLAMMMLIYLPAVYVATGVVEEKSSRIVELLLATVRPWQLLAGKIIRIGLLGLFQLAVIAATGLTAARLTGVTAQLPPGLGSLVASVFGWFLLGYAFFSALAAASGALVSRQEDVNGVLTPMTALMMVAYGVGFLAAYHPGAPLARVLSVVPPFSVVVMPTRIASGAVPAWQISVAAGLMVVAVLVMVAVAARIYQRAVLRTGGRVRLTEVVGRRRS